MDIAAAGAANQASHPGRHCGASPDDSFNRDGEETTHVAHDSGYENKFEKRSYSGELRPVEHPNVGHDGNSHKTDCESSGGSEGKDRQPKNQVDNGTSGGLVQRGPTLRRDISRNSDNEVYKKEYERSNRQPCAVQLGMVDEEPPLGSAQKGSDVLPLHDTTTRNYTASNPPQIERLLLGEGPIGNTDFTSSATNGNILLALEAVGFKENHIDDDSLGLSILVEKELPIWTSDLRTTKVERYLGCWTAKEEVNLWLLKGRDGMIWVVDEYKQSYRLDEDYQKIVAFLESRL